MHGKNIGILLSNREWQKIKNSKNKSNANYYEYAKKGEELDLDVVFFTLNQFSMKNNQVEAHQIKNERLIKKGKINIPPIIYNPTKFYRKKSIKKLRELSQNPSIQIINEHHTIKQKHLFELMESQKQLKPYMEKGKNPIESPFTFYVLGQKDINENWQIPIIYAKDINKNKYSIGEVFDAILQKNLNKTERTELMKKVSRKILGMIQYYYPGIYEIGLKFTLNENGEVAIHSTCSVFGIIKDLNDWDNPLFNKIVGWPIDLMSKMMKNLFTQKDPNVGEDEAGKELKIDHYISKSEINSDLETISENQTVWVKITSCENDKIEIQVPKAIIHNIQNLPTIIKFGVKEEPCRVYVNEKSVLIKNNSYNYPIEILASKTLIDKMHIPLDFVYQLNISKDKLNLGPTIGLLLGEKNQLYNPDYMEKYSDRLGEYEKFGGVVIAFSSRSVDWEKKIVYGMVFDPDQKHWRYDSAPIPTTLYRRNFHQNQARINRLMDITNKQLFNSYHFKKSDLYLMKDEPEIYEHVPSTNLLQKTDDLINFIHDQHKIILKPVSLSRGRGIFIIEKNVDQSEGYILYDYRKQFRVRHLINDSDALIKMLESLNIFDRDYLFQKYIPLLKVNNRSFDVRVVMQKENINKWICTGIECRVAGENEDLTNIARGGEALTLDEVVHQCNNHSLSYSKIQTNILKLCHSFCDLMERREGHFAEFGIDIALDEEGHPWVLEANIFPSFKGFKKLDYDTYLKIRNQPLFYAVHLQGFKVSKEEENTDEIFHQNKLYL